MATNLQIDDKLITKAVTLGGHPTKKAAVTQALIEYIYPVNTLERQNKVIQNTRDLTRNCASL